jgi:hypothetical protein
MLTGFDAFELWFFARERITTIDFAVCEICLGRWFESKTAHYKINFHRIVAMSRPGSSSVIMCRVPTPHAYRVGEEPKPQLKLSIHIFRIYACGWLTA